MVSERPSRVCLDHGIGTGVQDYNTNQSVSEFIRILFVWPKELVNWF